MDDSFYAYFTKRKPLQYCEVISLQPIKKKNEK